MKSAKIILTLVGVAVLAGCASSDPGFYKHAPSVKPLEMPPDLTDPDIKDDFDIPVIGAMLAREPVLAKGGSVRLQRDGQLRWLEVEADTDAVWQMTRDFFAQANVDLDWETRSLGILETKWVKHYDTRFARDKFRIRVEPGSKPGVTLLYLTHRGQFESFGDVSMAPVWVGRPNDPELEIEVLGQMLVFMGLSKERSDELAGQVKKEKIITKLDVDAEIPSITIQQPADRAWKLAVRAADRLGYIVEERNEAAGKLVIRLGKVGVDEGFTPGHTLLGLGREVYHLHVSSSGSETQIEVLTASGGRDNSKAARDFLGRMFEKLQ
ncbi:MAG: outer membrane protein assembly factor BamC [Gammaproteobacteria bacterium]|nr:outer membrane protein assembly factor BamC [Gammaproteobacteria bacterium]